MKFSSVDMRGRVENFSAVWNNFWKLWKLFRIRRRNDMRAILSRRRSHSKTISYPALNRRFEVHYNFPWKFKVNWNSIWAIPGQIGFAPSTPFELWIVSDNWANVTKVLPRPLSLHPLLNPVVEWSYLFWQTIWRHFNRRVVHFRTVADRVSVRENATTLWFEKNCGTTAAETAVEVLPI